MDPSSQLDVSHRSARCLERASTRFLPLLVCTALILSIVPQAALAAPQCETGPHIEGFVQQHVPVPPLLGLTVQAASRKLLEFRLKLGKVLPSNGNGAVVRQSLEANRCVPLGTPVDVWIENAAPPPPPTVEVPNLRGQTPLGATLVLAIKGLKYGGSSTEESKEVAPGKIFNQQPAAGDHVPKGTPVVVTLAEAVPSPPSPPPTKTPPPPPILTLRSDPKGTAIPGELVTFTASLQGASAHVTQFQFNFGDGQESSPSESPQAQHSYVQDRNYVVTVTAILDGGAGQLTATTEIGVHEGPQPQVVELEVSPTPVYEKERVTFTAHVYPQEPAPSRYTFQFGDKSDFVSETPSATHTYKQSKKYQPFVTILATHGHKISSKQISLIVVPPPPPPSLWTTILVAATVLLAGGALGLAGYRSLQRIATRSISYNLIPGEIIVRLQTPNGRLKEDEFQFHLVPSRSVITVEAQGPVVRSVEVRK